PYLTRFLPALVSLATVPPLVLVCVGVTDPLSALILVATLPLVPVFMVLVGQATRERTDDQWAVLGRLSGHFLDVVRGLTTLRVFGRAERQVATIRAVTEAYRRRTLAALRWAFLSSLVLELLVTLSVALVAVAVGVRLVHGSMDLRAGLFVLLLAPELFAPVRQVGAAYHAAATGAAALGGALDLVQPALATPSATGVSSEAAADPPTP
nr:ABC transporter transmembrane domain-containing protein [Micromonospora sp. DSM 115978]